LAVKFHGLRCIALSPFARPTSLEAASERAYSICGPSSAQQIDRSVLASTFFQRNNELDCRRII
jgi:hypothetical protein